jgi:hypothetical protein
VSLDVTVTVKTKNPDTGEVHSYQKSFLTFKETPDTLFAKVLDFITVLDGEPALSEGDA